MNACLADFSETFGHQQTYRFDIVRRGVLWVRVYFNNFPAEDDPILKA